MHEIYMKIHEKMKIHEMSQITHLNDSALSRSEYKLLKNNMSWKEKGFVQLTTNDHPWGCKTPETPAAAAGNGELHHPIVLNNEKTKG